MRGFFFFWNVWKLRNGKVPDNRSREETEPHVTFLWASCGHFLHMYLISTWSQCGKSSRDTRSACPWGTNYGVWRPLLDLDRKEKVQNQAFQFQTYSIFGSSWDPVPSVLVTLKWIITWRRNSTYGLKGFLCFLVTSHLATAMHSTWNCLWTPLGSWSLIQQLR